MLRNVFLKSLRDQRRSLLFWSVGLVALALYLAFFYPTVQNLPDLNKILEQAPKGITALIGGQILDYTSPTGYLNLELFSMMLPILLLVYTIGSGSGAIAGEEEKGTLEFLLASPLPRWRVVAQKAGVMVAGVVIISAIFLAGLVIGATAVDMKIGFVNLLAATFSTVLVALDFGMLALFLGCLRGSRGMSLGISAALAVATYFLNSLGALVDSLKDFRLLSPFYHNVDPNPLVNGLSLEHTLVLAGIALVFFTLSIPAFERRDIGV